MKGSALSGGGTHGMSDAEYLARFLDGGDVGEPDWFRLIAFANHDLVTPRLLHALRSRGAATGADPEALAYLELIEDRNRIRNRRLWNDALDAARLLNGAGIEPLFIKGIAELARTPDPGLSPRILCDADIVVPPSVRDEVRHLLQTAGYQAIQTPSNSYTIGDFWREGLVGMIDLHWRLPDVIADALPYERVLRSSELRVVKGARFRIPDPRTALALDIAHEFLKDDALVRGTFSLRHLLGLVEDSATWSTLSQSHVVRTAMTHPRFMLALELQARMACHLFGRPVPGIPLTRTGGIMHRRRLTKSRSRAWRLTEDMIFRLGRDLGLKALILRRRRAYWAARAGLDDLVFAAPRTD